MLPSDKASAYFRWQAIRAEMAAMRAEYDQGMAEMRTELRAEYNQGITELRSEVETLKMENSRLEGKHDRTLSQIRLVCYC